MKDSLALSQGTFIYRRKNRPKAEVHRKIKGLLQYFQGPANTVFERYNLYKTECSRVEREVQRLESDWYNELAADMAKFVKSAASKSSVKHAEIPIGILVSGLAADENCKLFKTVLGKVESDSNTKLVAQLSSKQCPTAKAAFESLVKQLILHDDLNSTQPDRNEISVNEVRKAKSAKSNHYRCSSILDLKNWYWKRFPKDSQLVCSKSIVIVMEDVDFFQPLVVKDFLLLLSCSTLPIIFLLGVKHCLVSLDHIIPNGVLFRYQFFNTIDARQRLDDFMNEVIFSLNTPVRLSGSIVKYMTDCYLTQDFSVTNLKKAYQICLFEYYRCSKTVLLCKQMKNFDTQFVDVLNTLKSYTRFCQQRGIAAVSPRKRGKKESLDRSISSTYDDILEELEKYKGYMVSFFATLYLLYAFGLGLLQSEYSLWKNFQELYTLAWDGALFEVADENDSISLFQKFTSLVNCLSTDSITSCLKRAKRLIGVFHTNYMSSEEWSDESNAGDVIRILDGFIIMLKEDKANPDAEVQASPQKIIHRKKNLSILELKAQNKMNIERVKLKRASSFDKIKMDILNFITKTAKASLKPVHVIPFSEVFLFDNLSILKSQLAVNIQESIHKTTCSPNSYSDKVLNEMKFDTGILHDLVLEGGMRTVNMNQLYQSFKFKCNDELFQPAASTSRRASRVRKKHELPETETLHRFRHAVAELQYLGYIKPSSQNNPDEFMRLCWDFSSITGAD